MTTSMLALAVPIQLKRGSARALACGVPRPRGTPEGVRILQRLVTCGSLPPIGEGAGRNTRMRAVALRRAKARGCVCSPDRQKCSGLLLARCVIGVVIGLLGDRLELGCALAGTVEIVVLDKSTGKSTPSRVHLKD